MQSYASYFHKSIFLCLLINCNDISETISCFVCTKSSSVSFSTKKLPITLCWLKKSRKIRSNHVEGKVEKK